MPWREAMTVDLRREFVTLAEKRTLRFSELCRRYDISRKTGYKWMERFRHGGVDGLEDQSKAPLHRPTQTSEVVEQLILEVRDEYPDWGGRKLRRLLQDQGYKDLPHPSTITEILRRNNRLEPQPGPAVNFIRFEHPYPNDLWQMDFKGHFPLARGSCHPLTVLDDHSRYSVCLEACANEKTNTVKTALIKAFSRYGIPRRMTMDNGSPWGAGGGAAYTQLTVWLIEQGTVVGHSRPYHPQTQGKDERFHRTLKTELLGRRQLNDLTSCQTNFDQWRTTYNTIRPHESLGMNTPSTRYSASTLSYQSDRAPFEYGVSDAVRKVGRNMVASYQGYEIFLGQAFVGKQVGIRPTLTDGQFTLHFCQQQVGTVDLNCMDKRTR
jgi:transposase InsO family protein